MLDDFDYTKWVSELRNRQRFFFFFFLRLQSRLFQSHIKLLPWICRFSAKPVFAVPNAEIVFQWVFFKGAAAWMYQVVQGVILQWLMPFLSSGEGNRVAYPGELSKYFSLLVWSSVLKCIHLSAQTEFMVSRSRHLLLLWQTELMTDVNWLSPDSHSCDNGLEHMLSCFRKLL